MNYKIEKDIRILVIGDIMLDHYIYGSCNRISPEAPVQVVEVVRDYYTLGGAGNVLQNLLAFNCSADIISVVGNDENADIVTQQLTKEGINSGYLVKDKARCTTVKSRVMVQNHQLIRLDREITSAISPDIEDKIISLINDNVTRYQMVLLSDYNKGLLSPSLLGRIVDICKARRINIMLDPKGTDFSRYKGVNIIKPNKKEAMLASGIAITDNESLHAACRHIQALTGCDSVIVTLSEDGIAMYNDQKLEVIPTRALGVIDVTGAGDTVLASLAVAIASGNSLYMACNFANHAAAVVVNKVGSATATLNEVALKFANGN